MRSSFSVSGFLDWWIGGLAALLDQPVPRLRPWRTLFLSRGDAFEVFTRATHGVQSLGLIDPSAADEVNRKVMTRVPRGQTADTLVLRLAPDDVIQTQLKFPAGVRDVLDKILQNQVERIAPWPLDQAVFAFTEAGTGADGSIIADVCVTGRLRLDEKLGVLVKLGYEPGVVDAGSEATSDPVLNLRTSVSSTPARLPAIRRAVTVTAAASVLMACAGLAYVMYLRSVDEQLASDLGTAQRMAAEVSQSRRPEIQRQQSLAFEARRNQPSVSIVIEALTRVLPDDAYLERLEIKDGTITISGRATNAPSLIASIESSNFFSHVTFASPTTRIDGENRSQFSIAARIEPRLDLSF